MFILFLVSTLASSLLVSWGCFLFISNFEQLVSKDIDSLSTAEISTSTLSATYHPTAYDATSALVLLLWSLLSSGYLVSLTGFHFLLICQGKTTNEYLKANDALGTPRTSFTSNMITLCCDEVSLSLSEKYLFHTLIPFICPRSLPVRFPQ